MRNGDKIKMACQSMLVGKSWGITGVRVDPSYEKQAVILPTAQVTGLYSKYHGNQLLTIDVDNVPVYKQPYWHTSIPPTSKVSYLDILVSESENQLFMHVINRDKRNPYELAVNFDGISVNKSYQHFSVQGDTVARVKKKELVQVAQVTEQQFELEEDLPLVKIPNASVSVFVFEKK